MSDIRFQVVKKKRFEYFFVFFMNQTKDPLGQSRFGPRPRGHYLNKLGKGLLANDTYQISSTSA